MQNKPDWADAPKDANILVRNNEGHWRWGTFRGAYYSERHGVWIGKGEGVWHYKLSGPISEDHTPYMEKRPNADLKYDQGKLRHDLIPPEAEKALAEVLTFGADKYEPDSWRDVKDGKRRYMAAALRHINAHRMGEELDEESGLSHLAHALTNLAFLVALDD